MHNQILGKKGEDLAANFLERNGYLILDKNWRSSHLELDIVAKNDVFLVFVEVKTRSGTQKSPESSVNYSKQTKLFRAAQGYLLAHPHSLEVRFDVISIVLQKNAEVSINHYTDAFYPSW